jgi:hypothetical protein
METNKELNEKILKITNEIHRDHPELSKYISEMTDTIPDEKDPAVYSKALKDYYESLVSMVKRYEKEQVKSEKTTPNKRVISGKKELDQF